jgi:hypothetical protein
MACDDVPTQTRAFDILYNVSLHHEVLASASSTEVSSVSLKVLNSCSQFIRNIGFCHSLSKATRSKTGSMLEQGQGTQGRDRHRSSNSRNDTSHLSFYEEAEHFNTWLRAILFELLQMLAQVDLSLHAW